MKYLRRVATTENDCEFNRRDATRPANYLIPALKRLAKLI
jgi:hypothetical protein